MPLSFVKWKLNLTSFTIDACRLSCNQSAC
jgi:hypothetical protein